MKLMMLFLIFFASFKAVAQKDIIIIVNESNPVQKLTPFQISEMFMKKVRVWPNGSAVRFFDRSDNSPERKSFLAQIMKKSARELDQYWIGQKLYTGSSVPLQISSDNMAISLVSRLPGGISYISAESFQENKGVKKIEVDSTP